jgi:hypothetical protein
VYDQVINFTNLDVNISVIENLNKNERYFNLTHYFSLLKCRNLRFEQDFLLLIDGRCRSAAPSSAPDFVGLDLFAPASLDSVAKTFHLFSKFG